MLDIQVIKSDDFHDVATTTLIGAAAIMWTLERQARVGHPADLETLRHAYPTLARFMQAALVWIIIGGVPRAITFSTHDLGALRGDLIPVIIVKHVLGVAAVVLGVLLWRRANERIEPASLA